MSKRKTIAVVNGGGDAPGLNAVIRGVVRSAINAHGMRVLGIHNGFDGLIWPEGAQELDEESVSGILPRGGTILGTTNPGNPFAYRTQEDGKEAVHDYSNLCLENARRLGIEAFVVIGGDGTQQIARDFARRGMHIVVAEGVKLPAADPSGKPIPPCGPGTVANTIAFTLREMIHKELRVTVLGHVQRGGSPTPRAIGTTFGDGA